MKDSSDNILPSEAALYGASYMLVSSSKLTSGESCTLYYGSGSIADVYARTGAASLESKKTAHPNGWAAFWCERGDLNSHVG